MKWTEQEVEFLRENYYKKSLEELSEELGRSYRSVYEKSRAMMATEERKKTRRASRKAYYQAHKEKINAYSRAYNQAHKEKTKAYRKKYYQTHREELTSYRRAYYQAHKEEQRECAKDYYKANKEKLKEQRIKQYRKENPKKMTICWECRLALQDPKEPVKCEWACKRQPVKGWQADEAQINMGNKTVVGYTVRSCPKFTAV